MLRRNETVFTMTSHYYDRNDSGKAKLRVLTLAIGHEGWPEVHQSVEVHGERGSSTNAVDARSMR